jgi:hypothetical protein
MAANVNISGTESGWCSESDISINPANPSQIISASNTPLNQAQFWSSDGGATWKSTILQLVLTDVNHTDPAVGWTTDGTAWAVVLGMGVSDLVTRVYKSPDGGGTWNFDSTPSGSQTNTDRETFWVDRSSTSPYTDNMYIIWVGILKEPKVLEISSGVEKEPPIRFRRWLFRWRLGHGVCLLERS